MDTLTSRFTFKLFRFKKVFFEIINQLIIISIQVGKEA